MKSYKSDIEIARLAKLKPIQEILGNITMEDNMITLNIRMDIIFFITFDS